MKQLFSAPLGLSCGLYGHMLHDVLSNSTPTFCTLSNLSTVCIGRVVLEHKKVLREPAPTGCQPCSFSQYAFYAIN